MMEKKWDDGAKCCREYSLRGCGSSLEDCIQLQNHTNDENIPVRISNRKSRQYERSGRNDIED